MVVAHSFCNWCGLPRLWGRVEAGEGRGVVDVVRGKDDDGDGRGGVQAAGGRLGVGWTVAYYFILLVGAGAFYRGFWVLTESEGALAELGGRAK